MKTRIPARSGTSELPVGGNGDVAPPGGGWAGWGKLRLAGEGGERLGWGMMKEALP